MHGGINKQITSSEEINNFLDHLYLISSQDEWHLSMDGDDLNFSHMIIYEDDNSGDIININPFLHKYPTVHTTWGTLVYPHSHGSWEFSKIAVIVKASQYKDKIYKLNPYDTMLLIDKFVIDKNVNVVIAQSKKDKWETDMIGGKNKYQLLTEKANSVKVFNDEPKVIYENLLSDPSGTLIDDFITEYKTNYKIIFSKELKNDRELKDKFTNGIIGLNVLMEDKKYMTINSSFTEAFFGDLVFDPYVFAKTYFVECLREAIDIKIVEIQQSLQQTNQGRTNHINVQIYCNSVDKNNRLHNPVCYREIKSGQTDLLTEYNDNEDYKFLGNIDPSNNTPMIGESSILGTHSSSLLNNSNNAVIRFVTSTITEIINNKILNISYATQNIIRLKLQYDNLITRTILPVSFRTSTFKFILHHLAQKIFNEKVNKSRQPISKELLLTDGISVDLISDQISKNIKTQFNRFKDLINSHA